MGTLLAPGGIDEKWTASMGGLLGSTVLDEHMNRMEDLADRIFMITHNMKYLLLTLFQL